MVFLVKGRFGLISFAAIVWAGLVGPATAPLAAQEIPADEAAKRFGARSSVLDISLSPSGTRIAWIAPGPGHTEVLNVYDLDGTSEIRQIASNDNIEADLSRCDWATDERLVCEIFGMSQRGGSILVPFTRMFAIGLDGKGPLSLNERQSWRAFGFNQDGGDLVALDVAGEPGQILITRNYVKESSLGTRLADEREGLGVDRFDVRNGRRRVAEQPDVGASFYIADENGDLRLKARDLTDGRGLLTGERVFMVREPGNSGWDRIEDVSLGGQIISDYSPVAVDASENVLYA